MRLIVLAGALMACGGEAKEGPVDSGGGGGGGGPTFYADILPIIGENCQQCHNATTPMGTAFPLETYAQISPYATVLLKKMQPQGDQVDPFFMPPFNAKSTEDCAPPHPFRGNYHVDEDEVARFSAWIDAGKPEGDPGTVGPYIVPPVVGLTGSVSQMRFAGDYEVPPPSPDAYDTFRCFAMVVEDGGLGSAAQVWVDGLEFTPGNPSVAHHMLLFSMPDLVTHLAAGLVQDADSQSWDCNGGVSRADGSYDLANPTMMWGWVPGGLPLDLGDGMGMRITQNTGLIVQMHYNTLDAGDDLTDRSILGVRLMDAPPEREAFFDLFGVATPGQSDKVDDPPFEVPEGAKDHVESYTKTFNSDGVRLWGFIPHMHLTGTAIQMRHTSTAGNNCLVNVPRYDYNWQQMYTYDADWADLPVLASGDTLNVSCTYDNSVDNVMLEKYLGGPVVGGVHLGDGTADEMCLVGVGLACDGLCE